MLAHVLHVGRCARYAVIGCYWDIYKARTRERCTCRKWNQITETLYRIR